MNVEEEIVLDLSDLIFDEKYNEIKKREIFEEKIESSKAQQIKVKMTDKNSGGYRDLSSKIPTRAREIEELSEEIRKFKNKKLSKGNEKHCDRGKTKVSSSLSEKKNIQSAQSAKSDHSAEIRSILKIIWTFSIRRN
jgi:hypothetical protein